MERIIGNVIHHLVEELEQALVGPLPWISLDGNPVSEEELLRR